MKLMKHSARIKPSLQSLLKSESRSEFFRKDLLGVTRNFKKACVSGIEIEIEKLSLQLKGKEPIVMERPLSVGGIVLPTETKQRGKTPSPVAFDSMLRHLRSLKRENKFRSVSPDSDRGHIFALELGGPNTKYNIIPQWSGFQARVLGRNVRKYNIRDKVLL